MNRLFPLPLYTLLKFAILNGGFSGRGLLNTWPWLIKATIFEPLRWLELSTQGGKIAQHAIISSPVFILGYYRSGTTYLQQLFMRDDRFGHTSAFQAIFPEIILSCENWLTPALESLTRFFAIQNPIHRIPLTWNSPGEEDVAMTTSGNATGAQWGRLFPRMMSECLRKNVLFDNMPPASIETWKQSYLYLLKKISLANNKKTLILKSPPNTARIALILSLFPNAKFVFIHRDPYDVFASNKRLWKVVDRHYAMGRTHDVSFNEIIFNNYSAIMNQYIKDKNRIPSSNLTEISYRNLVDDPVATLKRLYGSLDLGDFGHCVEKIAAYADSQREYATENHKLDKAEISAISEKWGPFIGYWNYPFR